MPAWAPFVGGAYQDRSPTVDAEQCMNLFVGTVQTDGNATSRALYGTPGLSLLVTTGDESCRGCWSEDGRTFAVIGSALYALDVPTATATMKGSIQNDGQPVSFASNGRGGEQLAIVGGGQLKIFDFSTGTLSSAVTLPLTYAPVTVAFIDGYFLLLEATTVRVWFSALEDGTTWDALDFFARSEVSDNLVGLAVVRDRIWLFGSQNTELYYDNGDADTPFVPYPGSIMPIGAVSPYAIAEMGGALIWLAQSANGGRVIVTATEAAPTVVSTPAVAFALNSYSTVTDAEVLPYEQEGHAFCAFTFPTAEKTWVYDLTERSWHERGAWDEQHAVFTRWAARGVCTVHGTIVVGDSANGNLYTLDLDIFTDNDGMIRRVRRAPYLSDSNQWVFLDQFELGAQVGVGLANGQGSAPVALLRVSRDAAQTWGPAVQAMLGAVGHYRDRTIWRRLGRARADRLALEVAITDPVRVVLTGAWLRTTNGSGLL